MLNSLNIEAHTELNGNEKLVQLAKKVHIRQQYEGLCCDVTLNAVVVKIMQGEKQHPCPTLNSQDA